MDKKISSLLIIGGKESLSLEDYIPVYQVSTGTTKKVKLGDLLGSSVGDIKSSTLTIEEFSLNNVGTWLLMNGQSCAETTYATLTGNTTVPNALTDGRFLRQAQSGVTLGTPGDDAIREISGSCRFNSDAQNSNGVGPRSPIGAFSGEGTTSVRIADTDGGRAGFNYLHFDASRVVPTSTEMRPKNIAVNLFIRVN